MLKIPVIPKRLDLFCTLIVTDEMMQALNCATTGKPPSHIKVSYQDQVRLRRQFESALLNAKPEQFNFRHLTDPDEWNQRGKGDIRTANGAFFTLLYEYNKEAEREGKPIIDGDDLIAFLKRCVKDKKKQTAIKQLGGNPDYPTGNDFLYVMEVKAPIESLLQGKDIGILEKNEYWRKLAFGPETDLYVKVAFDPTYRRDSDGNLTILEDGIQPLSLHRDADSKNTFPVADEPAFKDKSWDQNYWTHIDPKLLSSAPKAWFKKYGSKYDPHRDDE